MSILLYFAGLIIGVAVFLWLLSTYHEGKDRLESLRKGKARQDPGVTPETVQTRRQEPGSMKRICPLCGSALSKYEALYAAPVESNTGIRILIYGCRYCYKPEEDPERKKRTDILGS